MKKSKDWWIERANGFHIQDEVFPEYGYYSSNYYSIEKRSNSTWVIYADNRTLNKKLEWEYESLPSSRTKKYLKNNRYSSKEEALEYLEKYIEKDKKDFEAYKKEQAEEYNV